VATAGWLAAGLPIVDLALGGKQGQVKRVGAAVLIAIYGVYLTVLYL